MMFSCLVELKIEICDQLTSAPCHFLSLKKLDVTNIKCMAFERIISKLFTLASLKIFNISQLVCLPEQLFKNNMSLMSIVIKSCSDLMSISPHQDITSLQSFIIDICEKLSDLLMTWLTLSLLETFLVINCPNLRPFPSLQGAIFEVRCY